jgi:hypothetical protein
MFETLVNTDCALTRHRDGPLATERVRYLQHCVDQGGTLESLRLRARAILWLAEHMCPNDFGMVDASRGQRVGSRHNRSHESQGRAIGEVQALGVSCRDLTHFFPFIDPRLPYLYVARPGPEFQRSVGKKRDLPQSVRGAHVAGDGPQLNRTTPRSIKGRQGQVL